MAHEVEQITAYSEFQNLIYAGGQAPPYPVRWRELEAAATVAMTPEAAGYVAGGAGAGARCGPTGRRSTAGGSCRGCCGTSPCATWSTTVLGTAMPAPLLLAPVGVQSILHPDGELAAARAAAALGCRCASTARRTRSRRSPRPRRRPALVPALLADRPRASRASLLQPGQAAGFTALVVTLDTWHARPGARTTSTRAYLPFLRGVGTAISFSDPAFRAALPRSRRRRTSQAAVVHWLRCSPAPRGPGPTCRSLREHWDGPIVLKGVQHPDDARARGSTPAWTGSIVSNHGGRQLDGAIAALDALPGVVDAVGDRLPVLFDCGIRTGRRRGQGARPRRAGRARRPPLVYGPRARRRGRRAPRAAQRCSAELDITLAMAGYRSHHELAPGSLAPRP